MRIQRINRSLAWGITILMLFLTLGNGAVVWADETAGNSTIEKHLAKGYVTQQDLKKASQNVETENGAISASHFQFVCVNHNAGASACTDLQTGSIDSIKGGRLRNNVPLILKNSAGVDHSFSRAHIGNTAVYFVGTLTIRDDDGTTQDYVYYTTDENITNKTVFPVLKANEKITLEYTHGKDHVVTYQFKDADGNITSEGPDGWSLDQVFGEERPLEVANGKSYNDTVTIPRGYKATVTVTRKSDNELRYTAELGEMMSYQKTGDTISLKEGSPDSIKLSDSITVDKITGDDVVTLQYEKTDNYTFDASMWVQTAYAKTRVVIQNGDSNVFANTVPDKCKKTFSDHSFSWDFMGWSANSSTWELDQLQINGEAITVPMVTMDSKETVTETTTLSTGTKITLSVKSNNGRNGRDAIRSYHMEITNCYEDLTISGGNMVSHSHRELAFHQLSGVSEPQNYTHRGTSEGGWGPLQQSSLIGKMSGHYSDPIRFKKADGYKMPHISYTKKDGTMLQEDDSIATGDKPFVQYLIRTDESIKNPVYTTGKDGSNKNISYVLADSNFKVVSYENWRASSDGYYYLRGTRTLQDYMQASNAQGVVLVNIAADPIKYGINYVSGAGRTQDGVQISPKLNDVEDMPAYQNGGESGYNCLNNQKVLISNRQPVDKTGKFIFDHWEALTTETQADGTGHPTETAKTHADGTVQTYTEGQALQCSGASIAAISDCFYYDPAKDRTTLTLRAVWRAREEKDAIPYMVNYYVSYKEDGRTVIKKIESRTHTVNQGAQVVADLYQYQDGKKQLSASIQNVLSGENEAGFSDESEYRVDETKTTKKIDRVTADNNTVDIYLVRVEKEEPSMPSQPTDPSQPSQPADPSTPSQPTDPSQPSQPTDPSQPSQPTEPSTPSQPTDPSQPSQPTDPSTPSQPTQPGTSESGSSQQGSSAAAASSDQTGSSRQADDAATTGDSFSPVLWIAIAAAALAGIVVMLVSTRRRKTGKK